MHKSILKLKSNTKDIVSMSTKPLGSEVNVRNLGLVCCHILDPLVPL